MSDLPPPPTRAHLALVGTTASGKSDLALALAREFGVFEIVSADSMQVYRGMDIGTAKPSATEQAEVRHHVIDVADATEEFALSEFQRAALNAVHDVEARGRVALLTGGTGLYLQSVIDRLAIPGQYPEVRADLEQQDLERLFGRLQELDPVAAARTEPGNRRRIVRALEVTLGSGRPFSSFGPGIDAYPSTPFHQIGVWLPRPLNGDRIVRRIAAMVDRGWLSECERLRSAGGLSKTAAQALGYGEMMRVLDGWPLSSAVEEIERRTRAFARRQRVWFRRDPRIVWFGTGKDPRQLQPLLFRYCENWLAAQRSDR